jgi:tetratricopeptide (TPR) repeat protein
MNLRNLIHSAWPVLVLVLAACGSLPSQPPRFDAADAANRRAAESFGRGEHTAALEHAKQAQALAASIEYENGMADAQINLSIIYGRLGQSKDAIAAARTILLAGDRMPIARRAEAALRLAILASDATDTVTATRHLGEAEAWCATPCALAGKIANSRAHLALKTGSLAEALRFADAGQQINRNRADREELANSLRIWANAALLAGRAAEATAPLREALETDKQLGLPRKIYRDLLLLGLATSALNDHPTAISYLQRAADVAQGDGDAAAIGEVAGIISDLNQGNTK